MSVMCTNYSEVDGLSQANNGAGTRGVYPANSVLRGSCLLNCQLEADYYLPKENAKIFLKSNC